MFSGSRSAGCCRASGWLASPGGSRQRLSRPSSRRTRRHRASCSRASWRLPPPHARPPTLKARCQIAGGRTRRHQRPRQPPHVGVPRQRRGPDQFAADLARAPHPGGNVASPIVTPRVTAVQATPMLAAKRARTLADIHNATCRARRQGLVCSACTELNARAARLEASCG